MESSSLQNGNGRGKSYKEEERVVPTSPIRPPSAPKRVARAPKCPRSFSPRENRRKRANLPHQRDWRLFRLALASCRQALLVDIFLLLLAISGHSLVWIFITKLPIYKKDTKNGD